MTGTLPNYTDNPAGWSTYRLSIEGSDDGAGWVELASAEQVYAAILPQSLSSWAQVFLPATGSRYRYYSLRYDAQLGGGGFAQFHNFGGLSLLGFSLYRVGA